MTTSKDKQRRVPSAIAAFIDAHPILAMLVFACLVCCCLLVLFWFVVFSGLSSTADFVYNHF